MFFFTLRGTDTDVYITLHRLLQKYTSGLRSVATTSFLKKQMFDPKPYRLHFYPIIDENNEE